MAMLMSSTTESINLNSSSSSLDPDVVRSLKLLKLDGYFSFDDVHCAAKDFGNLHQYLPCAILHPKSVSDIARTVKHVYQMGVHTNLTIAVRGHGHSLQGQAQAPGGIVINMESLRGLEKRVHTGEFPCIDVSGGELWINVLHESLKYGLAPKSWTDYLHLTVGGTLSIAGISGQAFRYGPQISNVEQVEIVNGKGEVFNCSAKQNADLFYGVLGGLGQFGIITRARITLEPAPKMVKWIRVLYSDFSMFTNDQEKVISAGKTFDYLEGFVIRNWKDVSNWRSSFNSHSALQAEQFKSNRTIFCLELTKNFNPHEMNTINEEVKDLLSQLNYIPSTLFISEVPYLEFLDRVHISEMKLRSKGLWEVPHPWLNLLIPRTRIHDFAEEAFGNILSGDINDPILIYPMNKSKWDERTSAITPSEDVFYLVAFLSSAVSSSSSNSLEHLLAQNQKILDFCKRAVIGMKPYMPYYTTTEEWEAHFGHQWEVFLRRKSAYDPLAMLAPGQRIFQRHNHSCVNGFKSMS